MSRSSKNRSYLADLRTPRAASTGTRRGSQHTWRSFISASRMGIVERAMPSFWMARRTSGVRGDADVLVELALRAADLDRAHDLGLGRQIARHLLLHAAEHEGRHARAQRRQLVGADLRAPPLGWNSAAELLGAAEKPGHQEFEERPQLFEAVFDGRAGEAEAMLGVERSRPRGSRGCGGS